MPFLVDTNLLFYFRFDFWIDGITTCYVLTSPYSRFSKGLFVCVLYEAVATHWLHRALSSFICAACRELWRVYDRGPAAGVCLRDRGCDAVVPGAVAGVWREASGRSLCTRGAVLMVWVSVCVWTWAKWLPPLVPYPRNQCVWLDQES